MKAFQSLLRLSLTPPDHTTRRDLVSKATAIVNARVFDGTRPSSGFGRQASCVTDVRSFPSAAEAEELDAFDARVARVVAAVRERRYGFDPTKSS